VDYDKIQNAARNDKETEILDRWFGKNIKKTYLMIADDYKECESLRPIIVQNQ
jgi:hypothetical protein